MLKQIRKLSEQIYPNFWQVIVYLIGGVLSAFIDIGLTWFLLTLKTHSFWAVTVGTGVSLVFNYLYHALFTFKSPPSLQSVLKYLTLCCVNYLLMLGIVYILHWTINLDIVSAKIIALPIIAVSGYFFGRVWVYKEKGDFESVE